MNFGRYKYSYHSTVYIHRHQDDENTCELSQCLETQNPENTPCTVKPTEKQKLKELYCNTMRGFPCGSVVKNLPANAGDSTLIPGLGRPLENRIVFLPGKSHGQRNLVGYSSWGCKELDTTQQLNTHMLQQHGSFYSYSAVEMTLHSTRIFFFFYLTSYYILDRKHIQTCSKYK